MSNDDLLKRCKEILEWQKTGILSGSALQNYADSKFADLPNNLIIAEAATTRQAMAALLDAQSRHASEREALVRRCALMVENLAIKAYKDGFGHFGDEYRHLEVQILALLSDSGSQG